VGAEEAPVDRNDGLEAGGDNFFDAADLDEVGSVISHEHVQMSSASMEEFLNLSTANTEEPAMACQME